jgi:hypothetical protein
MWRRSGIAAVVLAAASWTAPAADARDDTWLSATVVKLTGTPLEVGVGENASLHAQLDGGWQSDAFSFDKAGLTLAVSEGGAVRCYGTESVEGDALRFVSPPAGSGGGTDADPWRIVSTWDAGSPARLRVVQTVRFVDGSRRFSVEYAVQNVGSSALSLRAYVSGQLNGGFAVPLARRDANVPGSVGMVVPVDGGARDPNDPVFDGYDFGRWVDLEPDGGAPWQRAVSGEGQPARLAMSRGEALPASLPARGRDTPFVAAEWDEHAPGRPALAPGATMRLVAHLRLASGLRTTPLIDGPPRDRPYTLNVGTDLADGGPLAGRRLGYAIFGDGGRDLRGTLATDAAGHADLTWTAGNSLNDRVVVWDDRDGDGTWDRDVEMTRQSRIDWDDTAPAPSGPVASRDGRLAARVWSVRTRRLAGRRLRVTGRVTRPATGVVTVRLLDARKHVRSSRRARLRAGRFRAMLRRPSGLRRATLVVRYAGDAHRRPASLRRVVRLR